MKTGPTGSDDMNGKRPFVEGADDDHSQQQYDDDLHFFRSALSQDEERRVDVAAVQHRVGRIVRRRFAFRAVAAAAAILIGSAAILAVARREPEQAAMPVVSEEVDLEFLRAAVAELENNLDALEREIGRPRYAQSFQGQSSYAASIWIATAEESFEEGTAAMLLTAALHGQDAGIAATASQSRFEEIVSYFPGTLAASAALEHLSKTDVQTN